MPKVINAGRARPARRVNAPNNTQQTAIRAKNLMISKDSSIFSPSAAERKIIEDVYRLKGVNIKSRAYDAIRLNQISRSVFSNVDELFANIEKFQFIEFKATVKRKINVNFDKYFFSLPQSEQELAEAVGEEKYKFIFVNLVTETWVEMNLTELLAKARKKYVNVSISF